MTAKPNALVTVSAAYSTHDTGLTNPDWNTAKTVNIDHDWAGNPAAAHKHATAQLLWTASALRVRFVARQKGAPLVDPNTQLDRKTIGLWNYDVCEVFLAPDQDSPHRYFEFEAAPTGAWVDLGIQFDAGNRVTDWEFDSGMTVETKQSDDEITIAMRIPWSASLAKPERGDAWRINLFRCVGTGNERYLAWQPTFTPEPNFHVPDVFGWLKFD